MYVPMRSISTLHATLDCLAEPLVPTRVLKNLNNLRGEVIEEAVGRGRRLLNAEVDVQECIVECPLI